MKNGHLAKPPLPSAIHVAYDLYLPLTVGGKISGATALFDGCRFNENPKFKKKKKRNDQVLIEVLKYRHKMHILKLGGTIIWYGTAI